MGRKSRRRKKHNRISVGHHFMKPFILTFSIVMLIGVSGIATYQWIVEPVKSVNTSHFQVSVDRAETVGESETELAAEVEEQTKAQIEEIISVNDKYDDVLNDPAYMVENNIYAKNAAEPDRVTITFAGDILFDDNYAIMTRVVGNDDISNGISPELIEEMKSADIMMLNNEFPYSDGGSPLEEKQFTFRAKPYRVSYLNDLGVDIVSLANNHAYD